MTHSPAPWVNERMMDFGTDTGERHVLSSEGKVVCHLLPPGGHFAKEQRANARLIAASPALLEACQAFQKAFEHGEVAANGIGSQMMLGDAIEKARLAIAKATVGH